ncbi:MAG: SRPBCC family protein [Chloroflexota bacterium]
MIIEDTFTIQAPIEDVWHFFLDVEQLSSCMPGVERVEQTSETTYEGSLKAKVGPISATFGGDAEIIEQTAPTHLKAKIKAKDKRTASLIKGTFDTTLTAQAPRETEVAYQVDVAIRGKLGQFGQTIIKDTAKSITAIFVGNVRAKLEQPASEAVEVVSEQPLPQEPNMVWVVFKSVFGSIWRNITGLFQTRSQS